MEAKLSDGSSVRVLVDDLISDPGMLHVQSQQDTICMAIRVSKLKGFYSHTDMHPTFS